MTSRPKRVIKAKRWDDDIYVSDGPCKASKRIVKQELHEVKKQKNENIQKVNKEGKKANARVPRKRKRAEPVLTEANAAIYRRLKDCVKQEADTDAPEQNDDGENLPKKRVPKPSMKLRIKEEEFFDEELGLDESESEESDYSPVKASKKVKKVTPTDPIKVKQEPCEISSRILHREEKIEELTVSSDRISSGKDKIVQLPDNRLYFEFAEPKTKVILQIKSKLDTIEVKSQSMSALISSLSSGNLIGTNTQQLLETFRDFPDGIQRFGDKNVKTFTEEVAKFATILYFYSPKAYTTVRSIFCLPNEAKLQSRLLSNKFLPGFTQEAFRLLKIKNPSDNAMAVCSIMLDFMPLRKEQHWDAGNCRWFGNVDFGGGPIPNDSDEVPLASDVLLLTAVGIGADWKLPFGYFLNNNLSGEELHSIVTEAINFLETKCGLKVKALVCDGSQNTLKMGSLFGCSFNVQSYTEIITNFPHPLEGTQRIHLIFGIHHALKILRKLLAEKGGLRSSTYGIIKWEYFKRLLGNGWDSLPEVRNVSDTDHAEFYQMQNIVRHCNPSFSFMENKALALAAYLQIDDYMGSSAAANFVADIYRAFDLLNSRNPVTTGDKPPITNPFLTEQLESMTVIGQRLFGLEFLSGKKVVSDGRWMSVMLFVFTLKSVSILASELLNEEILMYITTYRLNLDHSDMIFQSLQRLGEWNSIPSAAEFYKGYKTLFNTCIPSKVSAFSIDFDEKDLTIGQGIICPIKRQNLSIEKQCDNYFMFLSRPVIDQDTDLELKGRCIIKHISKRLTCVDCMCLMLDDEYANGMKKGSIILNYIKPSRFIVDLLKISSLMLKVELHKSDNASVERLVECIYKEYVINFEKTLLVTDSHVIEEPYHFMSLIRVIIRTFVSFRVEHSKRLSWIKSRFLRIS